ncbi:P-loop containing nucleoside triphosphate hydrolase protein [Pilobolus umbonatus]|nr:P-loop containing nucleoside triphosphate hydrolase protein [Pilobolus umbonatus]
MTDSSVKGYSQQSDYSHYRHCLSQCVSQVSNLVRQLTDINDIYYPTTLSEDSFSIFKVDSKDRQDSHLMNTKLNTCLHHLDSLSKRVYDSSSKILVTGDLNSGKSTLVNALLRREILPTDQQPCTSVFSEVLSIPSETEREPLIHAIKEVEMYDRENPDSYEVVKIEDLYRLNIDMEDHYKLLKIYTFFEEKDHGLLVRNGIMDITLIDSPGLNTDSVKTTAVFAREEEIDVVIFVVSAENHFTLSGKEFLGNAAHDKLHVFIVVNRFDSIRDKDRCKRLILEQIRQLSPSTYENASELVHFVSAENEVQSEDFIRLEQTLNSFVFQHRIQSKLLPAKNYLANVLRDVYFVSSVNESKCQENHEKHLSELNNRFLPGYSRLLATRTTVTSDIQLFIRNALSLTETKVIEYLEETVSDPMLHQAIQSVPYPGVLLSARYAQSIANALSDHLESSLEDIEFEISQDAMTYLQKMDALASEHHTTYPKSISHIHRRIQVFVEPRDFLINRTLIGKKWFLNILSTGLFSLAFYYSDHSRKALSVTVLCQLAWTGYSFVSTIPIALQHNLKHKFQNTIQSEKFISHQSAHIIQELDHILDTKKTDILSRMENRISLQTQQKLELEQLVMDSELKQKKFQSLVIKSNELRDQLDGTMDIKSLPLVH